MLVYPLSGTSRDRLSLTLREQGALVSNLRGQRATVRDLLAVYIEWAHNAASALRGQISTVDIDHLVWTARYQLLASRIGMLYPDLESSGLVHVLKAELDDRTTAFEAAHHAVAQRIRTWSGPGTFVSFDTSVYIEGDKTLEETDIADLIGLPSGSPIRLLVPMAVVDELDGLKRGGRHHHNKWRAGYTTAVLSRVLGNDPSQPALLQKDNPALAVELLPDPPGHVRLPITDDEIIDRVAKAQPLADREITLVTYDTGQHFRAGLAGLRAQKMANAIESEDEPERPQPPKKKEKKNEVYGRGLPSSAPAAAPPSL